jgi:hypothetical protein
MVRVKNTDVEYFVDYINKAIHLLDGNKYTHMTLTNSIDPTWQRLFVEQEALLIDVLDFTWFCYATDGIVSTYSNYNFKFIADHTQLHQPYVEIMRQRKAGIQ